MKTDKYLSNKDGVLYATTHGEGNPSERVTEILAFKSETREMELRVSESGKVAITTKTVTGEDCMLSLSPESFAAMCILVLRIEARMFALGISDPDLSGLKFYDARKDGAL